MHLEKEAHLACQVTDVHAQAACHMSEIKHSMRKTSAHPGREAVLSREESTEARLKGM